MSAEARKLKSSLFTKNSVFGFGIAVLFFALLFISSFFLNQSYLETLADKLASETVSISRHTTNITATIPEETHTGHVEQSHTVDPPDKIAHADVHQDNEHHEDAFTTESAAPLPTKPISGLYELNSKGVVLPIIRQSDNLTPFQAYSSPYQKSEGFSQVALVVDDFGLAGDQKDLLEKLPRDTSFILSPYGTKTKSIAQSLLQHGHEIWMKAPFETTNFPEHDPGPKAILKRSSLNTNQDNLKWVMEQSEVYAGIAGYTDTVFSGANPTINTLTRDIMNRGLGFFEINIGALPQIRDIAENLNAPYTKNDIVLHDQKWNGQFTEALELLENIAKSRGTAVAVLRVSPEIVKNVHQWSKSLGKRNIEIVPLSTIIKERNPKFTATLVPLPNLQQETPHPSGNATASHHEETKGHDEHGNAHH